MCGIAGILHFDNEREVNKQTLAKMTSELEHRGPDGEGYYINKNVSLGHKRLSIIDLSTGNQPMFSNDGSIVIVFNGEIYNYVELKNELLKKGYNFKTSSDTEVIINAYSEWGESCLTKFNGMWAFALWDTNKYKLILARDRVGKKPLHYSFFDNSLIFGSEINSIFAYGVSKEYRYELLQIFLLLSYIPAPDTFYKNIFKLLPGHYLIFQAGVKKEVKYWDLPEINEDEMLNDKKYIYDEFSYLLSDAVKIRMRSDVPYGAFLSGGLDSSTIVSIMASLSQYKVETFTIGFNAKKFDESKLANEVAERYKTNHHLRILDSSSLQSILSDSDKYFDEPFGDSSSIATFLVSSYAAQKVKMVLTGDGGDEVLSGYNSYKGILVNGRIAKFESIFNKSMTPLLDLFIDYLPLRDKHRLQRINRIIHTSKKNFAERFIQRRNGTPIKLIKQLFPYSRKLVDAEEYTNDIVNRIPYKHDFYKLMYMHFKYDLPNGYLVKVDRMSMANSIETRSPFLDYRLIEFMVKVDKSIKLEKFEQKSILKKTLGKDLPKRVLHKKKSGFSIPLRDWLKYDFNCDFQNMRNIIDQTSLNKLLSDHFNGTIDNSNVIWNLLVLNRRL